MTSELAYPSQAWMIFSIYRLIQIFFAESYSLHLQKYWHHLQQKVLMYHLHRVYCWYSIIWKISDINKAEKVDPRVEPCSSPNLISNYSGVWPFSRTLWNLLLKKLSMTLKRESETPIWKTWVWILAFVSHFVKSPKHIEKHATSFKSGISLKSFNFAYFFIKNHNVETVLREE